MSNGSKKQQDNSDLFFWGFIGCAITTLDVLDKADGKVPDDLFSIKFHWVWWIVVVIWSVQTLKLLRAWWREV